MAFEREVLSRTVERVVAESAVIVDGFFSHTRTVEATAREAVRRTVDGGAGSYERGRHLWRLLRREVPATADGIVDALRAALDTERGLGASGHWSYDLNRHIALSQALRAEMAEAGGSARAQPGPHES